MTMVAGRSYELLIFCRVGLCHFTDLCKLVYNLGKMLNCPSLVKLGRDMGSSCYYRPRSFSSDFNGGSNIIARGLYVCAFFCVVKKEAVTNKYNTALQASLITSAQ